MWWRNQFQTLFQKIKIYLSIRSLKFHSLFLLYAQVEDYQNILKLRRYPFAFTSYKAFLKCKKEVWNQSPWLIFCMIFEEKFCSRFILLTDQISLPLFFEISGNVFIVIVCVPDCDIIIFEIFISFLIKPFPYLTKRVRTKM